jgi:hypothetical protein
MVPKPNNFSLKLITVFVNLNNEVILRGHPLAAHAVAIGRNIFGGIVAEVDKK